MRRKCPAFTMVELLVVVAIIALLISLMMPALTRSREQARRSVCAANTRGIGQALHLYSSDNDRRYPLHYVEPAYAKPPAEGERPQRAHRVRWAGMMGTTQRRLSGGETEQLSIAQATSPTVSPNASHPSRALFLLVVGKLAYPEQFICPSTEDLVDDLHNRAGDCADEGQWICRAQPGRDRFDFRGMGYLSYGYQMPYGPEARPRANMDPIAPLFADRSPYSHAVAAEEETVSDRRDGRLPAPNATRQEWLKWTPARWKPLNSPNHGGAGQNVLYAAGHARFGATPMLGLQEDNIYTIQKRRTRDPGDLGELSRAPDYGPRRDTDTLIVP